MAKQTEINGIHFSSQKDAMDHTRNLLVSLERIGEITEKDSDWDYLNALIQRHPDYESKKGEGISSIVIKRDYNKNIAMDLKRIDDSIIDISWGYCVKSTHATACQKLLQAMRLAVKPQIEAFRRKSQKPNVICGICFKSISTTEKTHVDHHQPTFKCLADNFIKENNPAPEQFDDDPITNQAKFSVSDDDYSRRWQNYHSKHAQLRLTHAKCNLSRKRKIN